MNRITGEEVSIMMKKTVKRMTAALLLAAVMISSVGCGNGVSPASLLAGKSDPEIHIYGSSTLYPVMSALGMYFTSEYGMWNKVDDSLPEENICIYVASGTSKGAANAVEQCVCDFGMVTRPLEDEEKDAIGYLYKEFVIAKEALLVCVNSANTVTDLDHETLRKIFAGEIATWDRVDQSFPAEKINVYICDPASSTCESFVSSVMNGSSVKADAVISSSMSDVARNIASDRFGIGIAQPGTFRYANSGGKYISAVKVDGVEASEESIRDGSYIIQKPFMLITGDDVTPAMEAFLGYVCSETGYKVISEAGYVPAFGVGG